MLPVQSPKNQYYQSTELEKIKISKVVLFIKNINRIDKTKCVGLGTSQSAPDKYFKILDSVIGTFGSINLHLSIGSIQYRNLD